MDVERVTLPSDPSKWADIKTRWTLADRNALTVVAAVGITQSEQAVLFAMEMLRRGVTAWNITPDVPTTEAFEALSEPDGEFLQNAVLRIRNRALEPVHDPNS